MFQNTEKDIITKKTKKNLHKEAYLLKKNIKKGKDVILNILMMVSNKIF